jgi:uncharacterized membrane protein (UPF0127 family)
MCGCHATIRAALVIAALGLCAAAVTWSMSASSPAGDAGVPAQAHPGSSTAPAPSATTPATAPAQSQPATHPQNPIEKVTIAGEQFKLELAADATTRANGFMGRTSIPTYGGMLFVHTRPEVQAYWMANCLTDMDIMFLDARGRIVATHAMKMEPPKREDETQWQYESRCTRRYSSSKPALFAIELKAGTIERLKLKTGMAISLDLERLKKLAK